MLNRTVLRVSLHLLPIVLSVSAYCAEQAPVLLPLAKPRLLQALEYRVLTADQLLERISSRGVDFELSDQDWQLFTRKGASSRIVAAIRAHYRPTGASDVKAANANLADAQIYSGPPLLKREVELMLQMKVPLDKITKAVAARGTDFALTPDMIKESFELGGNLVFIGELMLNTRSNDPLPSPEALFAAVRGESEKPAQPASQPQPVLVASSTPVIPAKTTTANPVPTPPPTSVTPVAAAKPVPAVVLPTETAAKSPSRLVVETSLQATKLVRQVPPTYPAEARSRQISGSVRLEVLAGVDGHVLNTRILSGHPVLATAAMSAVRQWIYRPTIIDGNAVEVVTIVEVRFHP